MIPLTKMLWIFYLSLILGQEGLLDPAFDRIPFEQWLKGGGEARIRWSTRIFPSRLTVHQRLETILSVQVDGEEFVKRNGPGQVVVFVEIRGRDNRVYRTHRPMHFAELKNPSDLASVHFDQYAFITPGDYQVAEAIYDTESKEHSLKRIKLHVPGIAHDPLPGSWRDLPEVEFVGVPAGMDLTALSSDRLEVQVRGGHDLGSWGDRAKLGRYRAGNSAQRDGCLRGRCRRGAPGENFRTALRSPPRRVNDFSNHFTSPGNSMNKP